MSAISPTRVIGGRYVVLSELGRAGMGIVWRAEDRVMGRQVAVKELHLPAGLGADLRRLFRERLLREARTAGRLKHPGIVTVHDVVTDLGVDHIVMELIEARTLTDVVVTDGPLDERSATAVAQQLLDALGTAHAHGVVHRDVKPANVMLDAAGRVTLTDFGIAQAADDPRLTVTGGLVGSPGYIAPERLEGAPASSASDLWSLGATLFYALTGSSPFARETTAAVISAVLHADLPVARTRGPLGAVVGGLLQRASQARLGGAQAAALLGVAGAAPSRTPQDGTDATTGPLTRRDDAVAARPGRRWAPLAAALVVGLLGGVAGGVALTRTAAPDVTTLTYGEGGEVVAFDVPAASCLIVAPAPGRELGYNSRLSCDDRHEAELFATWPAYSSSVVVDYPGVEAFRAAGASTCRFLFDSPLIVGGDKGRLGVIALVPSEATFTRNTSSVPTSPSYRDRDVHCLLRAPDGDQLLGSRVAPQPG